MSDITMCASETCDRRQGCYRVTATPSDRQSYMVPPKEGAECDYYIPDAAKEVRDE